VVAVAVRTIDERFAPAVMASVQLQFANITDVSPSPSDGYTDLPQPQKLITEDGTSNNY